jgi:predicted DNA-binding transcriptional regulator AlpA
MLGQKITPKQLRQRFGNISEMTLWRWLRDESLGLPKPLVINRRKYFDLSEIETWERRRAAQSQRVT